MKLKYRTKLLALSVALILTLSFAGCLVKEEQPADATQAPETTAAADAQTPAAASYDPEAVAVELGSVKITAAEVANVFDYYIQMLSYYGSLDDETIAQGREMAIQYLIEYYMPQWKADALQITLTPEEEAEITAEGTAEAEEYCDSIISDYAYYGGIVEEAVEDISQLTEEQIEATIDYINGELASYNGEGYTFDRVREEQRESMITEKRLSLLSDKLRAANVSIDSVTDAQIDEWYAAALADQQESFDTEASAYLDHMEQYLSGVVQYPALYVPEGVLRVQLIEIAPKEVRDLAIETNNAELAAFEAEYGRLALNDAEPERQAEILSAYTKLKAENEELEEAYIKPTRDQINKAYALLEEETPFEDVMEQYNDGGSTLDTRILAEDDPVYGAELSALAAELLPGTYSEPIRVDDTFYIVKLLEKVPSGTVERASIEEEIRTAAAAELSDSDWDALETAWIEEAQAAAIRHEDVCAAIGGEYLE